MNADLRHRIKCGPQVTMISLRYPSSALAAFVATLGFDLTFIDLEHGRMNVETADAIVSLVRARGGASIIRCASSSDDSIRVAIDLDSNGVVVPNVDSVSEINRICLTCSLRSSVGPLLIPMIESQQAISDLDAIMSAPGVDALFLGPADLAQALGYRGEPQNPVVRSAADGVVSRAMDAGVPIGVPLLYRDLPSFKRKPPSFIYYDVNALLKSGAVAALAG
ncbi:MAG TPA: aldolase/citrate lyase family protein [Afipia sp.]